MNIPFVNLKAQYLSIKDEIDAAIHSVIDNTSFIKGATVDSFESDFAKKIGVKNCIGVANGTDALVIAMKALGIENSDEVIVPANSFIASSEAVTATGAKVVFVDNSPDTYNIDVEKIEDAISPNTKAIVAVHLYGQPANMQEIIKIARKHNLYVIEDSAQGHLAETKMSGVWQTVGSIGDIATFSFYPGKNLGAYGDAGAIVTNNAVLAKKARMYANHGRISKYDHEFEGINSRMDGIQGAVLGVKLNYLKEWTEKRRAAANYYSENLNGLYDIIIPTVPDYTNPVWHLYVLRAENRDGLLEQLKNNEIGVGVHYPIALPNLQAYKYLSYSRSDFPVASSYESKLISLPIFPEISREQQDFVIEKIKEFYKTK